jgi:hypothetical protein
VQQRGLVQRVELREVHHPVLRHAIATSALGSRPSQGRVRCLRGPRRAARRVACGAAANWPRGC